MAVVNHADAISIGSASASAVYVGATKVWPPPFRPTDIAGCAIWLDAASLGLANGAAVPSWPNRGSGPEPTLLGTPAPTFRLNALNGRPVVRITNLQGRFVFSGSGVDKDYTLAFIARRYQLTPGRVIAANASVATSPNILWGFHGNEFDSAYVEGWFNTPGPVGGITSTQQWKLYSGDSTATGDSRLFSNGVFLGSHPTPPATKGFAGTLCLSAYTDAGDQQADCEVAEVIQYNRKLSDAERQQVESYLRVKWGMPIPFKPTDLGANLLGWFDGADSASVQITGSGVSNWVNKSGGPLTLTQTVDANRPTYGSQMVTFTSPQLLVATNSPTVYDFVVFGRPKPPSSPEHRTLLRASAASPTHQLLLEPGNTMVGVWNGGFFPAGKIYPDVAMTSDAGPAPYVASAYSVYPGGYEAFKAFDSNTETFWHSLDAVSTVRPWIKIDLGTPRQVSRYTIQARSVGSNHSWRAWEFAGCNDDVNWNLCDWVASEPATVASERRTYTCDAINTYRYWRWLVVTSNGTHAEAAALELFGSLSWGSVWGIGYGRITSTAPVTLSRDGGPMLSTGTTMAAADTPFVSLGGIPGGQPWGDVNEIIFVTANSEGHRPVLEGYLAHKWGYAHLLPANHPYKITAP
jgi:hypothetical protein